MIIFHKKSIVSFLCELDSLFLIFIMIYSAGTDTDLVIFSRSGKNLAPAKKAPGSDEIPIRNSVPMLGAQLGS